MNSTSSVFEVGAVLGGKYRLDREIGEGGMGQVFAAWNTLLDAPVAIKVLHPASKPRPDLTKRFMQEARAAAQVRHANIVSVLDIGQDESTGSFFIVQEFLQGEDLASHLEKVEVMSPHDALVLLLPVMRALSYAHSKGVVHRDLKPDNIFLCDTPEGVVPKIIDFGIAKMLDEHGESGNLTKTSQVMGTPYFMSPEQACGDRTIDHHADIWSLGVVLYNMVTGRFPYEGASTNLIITNIIARAPTSITEHAPNLAPEFVALIQGALVYQPEKRFATMEAFWQAAKSCFVALGGAVDQAMVIEVTRPSIVKPIKSPVVPQVTAATVTPQIIASSVDAPASKGRWRAWIAVIAVVILSGIGGLALSLRDRPQLARPVLRNAPVTAHRSVAATAPAPTPVTPVVLPPLVALPPPVAPPPPVALSPVAPPPSVALSPVAANAEAQQPPHPEGHQAVPSVNPRHRPREVLGHQTGSANVLY